MAYNVAGTLKLPDGTAAAGVDFIFTATKTLTPMVEATNSRVRTTADGSYSINLEYNVYTVDAVYKNNVPLRLGTITIASDSVAGQDLPTLLSQAAWQPATPDYIVQITQWLNEAKAASDASEASAQASELNKQQSAQQATISFQSAAQAAQSVQDANQIKTEVGQLKSDVVLAQQDVTDKLAQVISHEAQVSGDAATVTSNKLLVDQAVQTANGAADTASQKATLAAQHDASAQEAATRAEQSAQALVGALLDAGAYDASTGVLPTPLTVAGSIRSCMEGHSFRDGWWY